MLDSLRSRRELFRHGGLLAAAPAFLGLSRNASAAIPATAGKLQLSPGIYKSIGVRPLINCRGTLTVISGSMELPEVRAGVDAGARHHVALDALMEAVARRTCRACLHHRYIASRAGKSEAYVYGRIPLAASYHPWPRRS